MHAVGITDSNFDLDPSLLAIDTTFDVIGGEQHLYYRIVSKE